MEETYVEAWKDYRRRRQMYAISFLSFPLVGFVAISLQSAVAFVVIGATWLIFSIVSMIRFGTFRCPRCQKRFFSTSFTNNPFAAKCLNCGLPKWAVLPEAGLTGKRGFRMTRRIWWRVMLGGATISALAQIFTGSWARADWPPIVLSVMAVVILHPLMDRDVETPFDSGMLRSWRAYVGIVLLAISSLVMFRK
jgi:hypothetical protein